MDDSLAQWLALREPSDTAARSISLTQEVSGSLPTADPVNVLDLATGAGSNLRYLANQLPGNQRWLVVDRSSTLLAELPARTGAWGAALGYEVLEGEAGFVINGDRLRCHVEMRQMNLETLDETLFAGRHLVTASALLDLVSEGWLRSLALRCRAARAAVLFTITYNGRSSCAPVEPEDGLVLNLFNLHQRTDKGLGGPAAGPDAVACAARCFAEVGYQVRVEQSDWELAPGAREIQRQLIEGWAGAAAEISPADAAIIADWRIRRLQHVDAERSRILVGHHDLGAWLPHL